EREAGEGQGPASASPQRVEAGGAVTRTLIPESLRTIAVDEPLVTLCDGCEYRIVVPVRVADRSEIVELPFRLEVERRKVGGVRGGGGALGEGGGGGWRAGGGDGAPPATAPARGPPMPRTRACRRRWSVAMTRDRTGRAGLASLRPALLILIRSNRSLMGPEAA